MRTLADDLATSLAQPHGTVLLGSGDYHHLSALLIAQMQPERPMRVIVLDNHPDNMRFMGHIHCGSWVSHACALSQVAQIDVIGITSSDIGWRHAWENRLSPLRAGRLRYWSVGVDTSWARWVGAARAMRGFANMPALLQALVAELRQCQAPVYLSIDKDVFAPDVVRTNWDQGVMRAAQAQAIIAACHGRIIASDITGEVSSYTYGWGWKRWVSALDGQDLALTETQLASWRAAQHRLNLALLCQIADASKRI
jgi:arginase family enzyme